MNSLPTNSFWPATAALVVLMAGTVALEILYFFDPSTHAFYPVCPLHQLTGLSCPGCGTLRALHQLAHGNFAAAWGFNPFTVALLPVGIWLGLREAIGITTGRRLPGIVTRPAFGWAVLVAMILFGVLRNVPMSRLLAAIH
jgi:hypothetical protein